MVRCTAVGSVLAMSVEGAGLVVMGLMVMEVNGDGG